MKWQVPDLCHVNGATWFSGGAVSTLNTISTNVHFFQSTLCVLYMAHFAYCTKHILHSVHTLQCTDCLSQVCHMPYAECALYHMPLCHVPCAIVLCAMCHVPCTECALYRSLTLDNGPSVSRSALLIEFLHRGHFPNEGTAKNK